MQEVQKPIEEKQERVTLETQSAQGELPEATPPLVELEELQKEVERYKDLLLRKAAEFENYKRRVEQENATLVRYANEDLLSQLLPVLDDFERSLTHSKEAKDVDALIKGIELIYQKFMKVLEANGVKTFESVGKPFDVQYHDALMQIPRTDVPPFTVLQEVERGYMLYDKVLRHAKVVVSTIPVEEESNKANIQQVSSSSAPESK
ncbi:MAG: nucleotide exchange factor GrpE [Bacteroidetes bacterium]|nr:nucleotide exchange factor GrpE [Bacteroidota bacterium]